MKKILSKPYFNLQLFLSKYGLNINISKGLSNSDFQNNHEKCVVLGNGPSLKEDTDKILKIDDADFFCVNQMAESPIFDTLQPTKYCLLDSYFWAPDAAESLLQRRNSLFLSLNQKVSWDLTIYVPKFADLSLLKSQIINPKINIFQLDLTPLRATDNLKITERIPQLLNQGYYGPPDCNVIIYAMFLAIMADYREIELFGADLSFTEDVIVDQKTNQLFQEEKHFYGESELKPLLVNPQRTTPFDMESLYHTAYQTFYAHNLLSKLAKIKNITVSNRSSYSLIDSYDR